MAKSLMELDAQHTAALAYRKYQKMLHGGHFTPEQEIYFGRQVARCNAAIQDFHAKGNISERNRAYRTGGTEKC